MKQAAFLVLLLPSVAAADIHLCNGRWINGPCDGVVTSSLKETVRAAEARASLAQVAPAKVDASKCASGQFHITSRPDPVFEWSNKSLGFNGIVDKQKLEGKVFGHGRVRAYLTVFGRMQDGHGIPREKQVFTRIFNLPDDGGHDSFSTGFEVPNTWQWHLRGENVGTFEGFCSSRSQGELSTEWRNQKTARNAGDSITIVTP